MSAALGDAAGGAGLVSQRDIARHFGVSHVTVSLALRNSSRVSKSLGDRIRAHANAVGYHRDPVLVALADYKKRKTSTIVRGAIAWINAWPEPHRLRAFPEIDRFWHGAGEAAREYGLRLEEFRLGTELSPERLHQVLQTRNIRGVVLPPHPPGGGWHEFPWDDYAVVGFGRAGNGPRGHRILPSAASNVALALRQLRAFGYRQIGCLAGDGLLRQAGYCMADCVPALRMDFHAELPLLDLAAVPEDEAPARVRDWVRAYRLDAVVADDAATGGWLAKAGLSVPGELALATLAAGSWDNEAGIDPELADIGRTAVRMLDELLRETISRTAPRYRQVAVEGTWTDGESAPPLAGIPPG
jgi:DNA-binding LacI/PurR family transcriptional regulator